ncbi:unnamed protein product, partial [Allacma fusca]
MVGPKVQEDLIHILLRFRVHTIALKADIEKMYRQILVSPEDRSFQQILWRKDVQLPVDTYKLNTVTYGTASAPYQAVRCVKQLACDERDQFPEAAAVASTDFYVDDLMSGAHSSTAAIKLQSQLVNLFACGGFPLKKWSSNDPQVLAAIPEEFLDYADTHSIDDDPVVKTLGLQWHPSRDTFSFKVRVPVHQPGLTKRTMLSEMSRLFDPLGWLAPVTIKFKVTFQKLWEVPTEWDEELTDDVKDVWALIKAELPQLEPIRIPRCITQSRSSRQELHGFSDASEVAYGAVVYLRSISPDGNIQVRLVCAKTRVAPVKKVTLPRLELCGALLLTKVLNLVRSSLKLEFQEIHGWTDATIVLHWIRAESGRWQTFVANRVSQIQSSLPSSQWHHVKGKDNPADCASRGILPSELPAHSLWWTGPPWLKEDILDYSEGAHQRIDPDLMEIRKARIVMAVATADTALLPRYSSLWKLKRITSWILRFAHNSKGPKANRTIGPLTPSELEQALMTHVRVIQRQVFQQEVEALSNGDQIHKKSKLWNLHPFLDSRKVLRVGGRIQRGDFPDDKKHPALLPASNHLTTLVICEYHEKALHGGPTLTLSSIQERFWIIQGRRQIMGDLPVSRLRKLSTFENAVHLELVEDLTTDACLGAVRAFISRRGKPAEIRSDCGTNM